MNSNSTIAQRRSFLTGATVVAGAALAAASGAASAAQSRSAGRFAGKVVLITGATSGIGRSAAEKFAAEGAKVMFCGRREALGREVEAGIRRAGGEARFMRADVTVPAQVEAFVNACVAQYGRIDIAFNNAGNDLPAKSIAETSFEDYDSLMNTHARGVFAAMKYELPIMVKQGGGQIVNTASVGAHNAYAGVCAYTAAKAAVMHLTKTAAVEFGDKNIRTMSISPGWVDTPMMDRATKAWGITKEQAVAGQPSKRAAKPEEIAEAVMFLVSANAAYISGTDLLITGGWQG
jgi:NAD(P)-dependent dehydrogenase (short-subunit alcohol dehydrogenase family)